MKTLCPKNELTYKIMFFFSHIKRKLLNAFGLHVFHVFPTIFPHGSLSMTKLFNSKNLVNLRKQSRFRSNVCDMMRLYYKYFTKITT